MKIKKSIFELKKHAQLNKHSTQLDKLKLSNVLGGNNNTTDGTNIIITDIYVG